MVTHPVGCLCGSTNKLNVVIREMKPHIRDTRGLNWWSSRRVLCLSLTFMSESQRQSWIWLHAAGLCVLKDSLKLFCAYIHACVLGVLIVVKRKWKNIMVEVRLQLLEVILPKKHRERNGQRRGVWRKCKVLQTQTECCSYCRYLVINQSIGQIKTLTW